MTGGGIEMQRQVDRTKKAITDAFTFLVFDQKYDDIRMVDIAKTANVGRSTVYQHFRDKDAVLLASMEWVLHGLAQSAAPKADVSNITQVLEHIWAHRDLGRKILFGMTGRKLAKALNDNVLAEIGAECAPSAWQVAPQFIANQMSASLMSVLQTWLRAEASETPQNLAQYLVQSMAAVRCAARVKPSGLG